MMRLIVRELLYSALHFTRGAVVGLERSVKVMYVIVLNVKSTQDNTGINVEMTKYIIKVYCQKCGPLLLWQHCCYGLPE